MEPIDYLIALRRHWLVITLLSVLGVGGGWLTGTQVVPTYQAKSSVLLTPSDGVANHELGEVGNYMNYQIHSYAELASRRVVLDAVIEDVSLPYGVEALAGRVSAQVPVNTSIINIGVVDTDPRRAARAANAVAEHLVAAVEDASPKPEENSTSLNLRTVAEAAVPQAPIAPRMNLYLAGGGALGLFLGVLYAVARYALARTRQDVRPKGVGAAPLSTPGPEDGVAARATEREASRRELEEVRS